MSRLIDVDAFKDYIREACEDLAPLFNDNGKVARLVTESFCKDIDEQPTIQPEPHWIPCSERLPEVNEDGESDYILLNCSNYSLPSIGRYQVDDNGGAFYSGDDDKPLVSYGLFVNAWMPLPESYQEEGEQE